MDRTLRSTDLESHHLSLCRLEVPGQGQDLSSRTLLLQECPCTNTTGITWKYVRNAESQVPCQTCRIRICILTRSLNDWFARESLRKCGRRIWRLVKKLLGKEHRSRSLQESFGLTGKTQQGNRSLYKTMVIKKQPWIVVASYLRSHKLGRLWWEVVWPGSQKMLAWNSLSECSSFIKHCSWSRAVILSFGCTLESTDQLRSF